MGMMGSGAAVMTTTYITISGAQLVGAATIATSMYMFARTSKRNGYWAEKYMNDHAPNHVHFKGTDGTNIRIDEYGNPLKGDGPLNAQQRKILKKLWEEILKLFKGGN